MGIPGRLFAGGLTSEKGAPGLPAIPMVQTSGGARPIPTLHGYHVRPIALSRNHHRRMLVPLRPVCDAVGGEAARAADTWAVACGCGGEPGAGAVACGWPLWAWWG